ncbi:hypothetical protein EON64_04810 [archaeon]|nr:MAG: hypothetical protein EON64_04810 [archaeon]
MVDEPLEVPDPKAVKPEDWSDEEDGEWEPPLVPNPRCETAAGCGKWTPPLVDNPLYKGKWVPPKIKNPSYKGIWKPRLIPNPNYFEDLQPALSAVSFSALAVEVWTTNAGVHFDNFLIAEGQASQVGQFIDLFKAKHLAEKEKFKQEHPEEAGNEGWQGLLNSLHSHVLDYVQLLATDKLALGVTIAAVLGSALLMSFLLSTAGDKVRKEKRDKKEMEARDESKSEEVSETTRELAGADKPDSQ